MDLKSRISTPLEAGTSILDVHRLPPYLVPALEYASKRLAEKGLHITLAVVRRDYQLPGFPAARKTTSVSEGLCTTLPTPPCSPALPGVTTIRKMGRSRSLHTSRVTDKSNFARLKRSKTGSLSSLFDGSLSSPRLRWATPPTSTSFLPKSPKTPATPASCMTSISSASSAAGVSSGAQGLDICLIYTTALPLRACKIVAATLARASRKFSLPTALTAHDPSTCNMPAVVLHSSVLQNDTLHSSEGLTLLSLDHLYTFKCALNYYAAIRTESASHFALEDAVDELRRYTLSSTAGRRRLLKSTLVQAYDWLGPVNDTALAEVMIMYARAYGTTTDTGVTDDLVLMSSVPEAAAPKTLSVAVDVAAGKPLPPSPPNSAASMTKVSWEVMAATVSADYPTAPSTVGEASAASSPASLWGQGLLSRVSAQSWVVEGLPACPHEAKSRVGSHVLDTPAQEQDTAGEDEEAGDKTPVPTHGTSQTPPPAQSAQSLLALPLSALPIPAQEMKPRRSAPALKLQTSFPTKTKRLPKRNATPMPLPATCCTQATEPCPKNRSIPISTSPSPIKKNQDLRIELTQPPATSDTLDEDDAASVHTDFEDAELTARSPAAAKTPGGSIWMGIDDMLLSGGGGAHRSSNWMRMGRRRSSSLFLQTPATEKMGPTTPNGYEDISPVTRGEWGFLMVGESFRTRTAGVDCV